MKSVAVFCGSAYGTLEAYKKDATLLGKELAKREVTLIYGGASVGMMGAVADAVIQGGGKAIGVIPKFMTDRELPHQKLDKLYTVDSMHERKALMMKLSDGFIALPGGPGTLEEFIEVYTWQKIGIHQKPCGLLNTANYFDGLLHFFDHMVQEEFLRKEQKKLIYTETTPNLLLDKMLSN